MASAPSEVLRPTRLFGGVNLKIAVAGAALALAVAYLVIVGLRSSTVYFLTVSELQSKGAAERGQVVRVSGNLVPGSLVRSGDVPEVQFQIADPTSTPLPVVYRGAQVPDIVGDNVEIVAEGKLDQQGTFEANTVLAKCPSKLENAPPVERQYSS